MIEISEANAIGYLQQNKLISATEACNTAFLGGGVSNIVLRVTTPFVDWVIKQSLPKLHVADEWLARQDRIFRESACMRLLGELIKSCHIPEVIFEDKENYIIIISAAPQSVRNYKTVLLSGEVNVQTAGLAGRALAEIHSKTVASKRVASLFGDGTSFGQLRIDPYYRQIAKVHPDISDAVDDAINRMSRRKSALVHGDFSPKNILLDGDEIVVLDFEVVHYGDPAFDAAFFLNHLFLKSIFKASCKSDFLQAASRFWQNYLAGTSVLKDADLEENTVRQLGCLMLARIDGKSPAEYIVNENQKTQIRKISKEILTENGIGIEQVLAMLSR